MTSVRDLLRDQRSTMRGMRSMYAISKKSEGGKSPGEGTPPMGAGKGTVELLADMPARNGKQYLLHEHLFI